MTRSFQSAAQLAEDFEDGWRQGRQGLTAPPPSHYAMRCFLVKQFGSLRADPFQP